MTSRRLLLLSSRRSPSPFPRRGKDRWRCRRRRPRCSSPRATRSRRSRPSRRRCRAGARWTSSRSRGATTWCGSPRARRSWRAWRRRKPRTTRPELGIQAAVYVGGPIGPSPETPSARLPVGDFEGLLYTDDGAQQPASCSRRRGGCSSSTARACVAADLVAVAAAADPARLAALPAERSLWIHPETGWGFKDLDDYWAAAPAIGRAVSASPARLAAAPACGAARHAAHRAAGAALRRGAPRAPCSRIRRRGRRCP